MPARRTRPITNALVAALKTLPITPADGALVALAKIYAEQLDAEATAATFVRLGPAYVNVLAELGMTPRSRSASRPGGGAAGANPRRASLDELRARRARSNGTPTVDPATPNAHP